MTTFPYVRPADLAADLGSEGGEVTTKMNNDQWVVVRWVVVRCVVVVI